MRDVGTGRSRQGLGAGQRRQGTRLSLPQPSERAFRCGPNIPTRQPFRYAGVLAIVVSAVVPFLAKEGTLPEVIADALEALFHLLQCQPSPPSDPAYIAPPPCRKIERASCRERVCQY